MSDLISRQAAIDAICNACGKIDCDKMDKCEKLQLPPANCSEFPNNSDTISRQAAIDALKGLPTWWADEGGYYGGAQPPMEALLEPEDAISALENLPSAQPNPYCSLAGRLCDTRGKEFAWCLTCPHISEEDRTLAKKAVEPKTGRWILSDEQPQEDVDNYNYHFICSECGKIDVHSKAVIVSYCWNCGARMKGADDE